MPAHFAIAEETRPPAPNRAEAIEVHAPGKVDAKSVSFDVSGPTSLDVEKPATSPVSDSRLCVECLRRAAARAAAALEL
jgi:uncharacterized protein (DUF2345 family)